MNILKMIFTKSEWLIFSQQRNELMGFEVILFDFQNIYYIYIYIISIYIYFFHEPALHSF